MSCSGINPVLTLKTERDRALVANKCVSSFPRFCLLASEIWPSSLNLSQMLN